MSNAEDCFLVGRFPDGFKWSTSTAAYQIEGAWDQQGRGETIWDRFCHTDGLIKEGHTGDIACDSFHKYPQDIQLMQQLGVKQYRFSIAWSRILPDGTTAFINQAGIDHYNRVIDALLCAGIEPVVTLYHWDLPQKLHEKGGWYNEDIIKHFTDYARICFRHFGDRVKIWTTFNEPHAFIFVGYGLGIHAPGVKDLGFGVYTVAHTVLKAHAHAYHAYDKDFRPTQQGNIGISLNSFWYEAYNGDSQDDVDAAERALEFELGWFANPIYGNGDYPAAMIEGVARKSAEQGLSASRLPSFTEQEAAFIKGTADFMGLNFYSARLVKHKRYPAHPASYEKDMDGEHKLDPAWKKTTLDFLFEVPWGIRKQLQRIKRKYNNPIVYITENGLPDEKEGLDDQNRIHFFRDYINEVLKAVVIDGCDVRGYTAWSLIDNFEWTEGYTSKFGLHHVDFEDPNRKRTPKASARYYAKIIKQNGFEDEDKP